MLGDAQKIFYIHVPAAIVGLYGPVLYSAVYARARRSGAPYRFHLAAEAGWDCGAAGGLFVVSAMGASAADRRVEIVNKTGMTMTEFYASNTGASDWEEDILGVDVLANGDTVRYRLLVAPVLNDAGHIESWTHFIGPIQLQIRPTGRLLLGLEQSLEAGHIRAARALLDWSMADLSGASGVSLSTIRRLEGCIASVSVANRNQVIGALRSAGIVFSLMEGATIAVSKGRQIAG